MKTEQPQSLSAAQADNRSAMNGSHHPFSIPTRLSDRAFYLIALALLIRKSAEPGSLQQFLVPGGPCGYQ